MDQTQDTIQNKKRKNKRIQKPKYDSESDDDMELEDGVRISEIIDKKEQLKQEKELQSNDMDYGNQEMDMEDFQQLNIDFDFYEPDQNQYFSIKNQINGLLDGKSYNSSELANIICDQKQVGNMIGIAEDEDDSTQQQHQLVQAKSNNKQFISEYQKYKDREILGFATIINFHSHKDKKVVQEIAQYISEKSSNKYPQHNEFMNILNSKSIGLLINERILNLSPQLVPQLFIELAEDIKVIKNQQDQQQFKFDYILIISRCAKQGCQNMGQKQKKVEKDKNELENFLYHKFEDYEFLLQSEHYFIYEGNTSKSTAGITNLEIENKNNQINMRIIALISYKNFLNAINKLDQYIEQ